MAQCAPLIAPYVNLSHISYGHIADTGKDLTRSRDHPIGLAPPRRWGATILGQPGPEGGCQQLFAFLWVLCALCVSSFWFS